MAKGNSASTKCPSAPRTRISAGEIQRNLGISRAVFERVLRDFGHEIPRPEVVVGCRLWAVHDLRLFREVLRRDQERVR